MRILVRYGLVKALLTMLIALQLVACIDKGDSETDTLAESSNTSQVASDVVVTGSVGDGPVIGATIILYSNTGEQIGSMSSDDTASFEQTFKIKGKEYPLILEVNGGFDLVTGGEPDFRMLSVMMNPSEKQVNINPFSTLIVKIAQSLPGGVNQNNISLATSFVMEKLGFGLDLNSVPDPITSAITEFNVANLVKASEAFGETVRRTRDRISRSGTLLSGDDVMAAIAADMTDGVLDGMGAAGTVHRIAAVMNVVSGQVLVEALSNNLKVGGIIATGVIDQAIMITNPAIPSYQLTDSVRITQGMLKQSRVALAATKVLDSSEPVNEISNKVAGMQADVLPQEVVMVLPADASDTLDYAVDLSSTVDETQLTAINEVVASGGELSGTSINSVPVISGSASTAITANNNYVFQPTATDADGDTLSFSIVNMPGWASFAETTGRLEGVPTDADVGAYDNIIISVTDGTDTASLAAFSITVEAVIVPNTAPVISGTPSGSVTAGSNYLFQPTATDADGDTLSFSIVNKPGWASFSPASGGLSGTPDNGDAGTYSGIQISVSDGTDTASLVAFDIRVDAVVAPNTAPTISGTPAGSVTAGNGYAFQPTATDADSDILSFGIVNKPGWASFSPATGHLSGTPDNGDAGTYSGIQISVSDGIDTASLAAFSITVEAVNTAPTISGTPAGSVTAGSNYEFQPTATDADGDDLTFSIVNKPSWASFSPASGGLSGTPDNGDAGTYSGIQISVSDGVDTASLTAFSITVEAVNTAPTISGTPAGSVTAGSDYLFQPTATDADGDDLTFSIANKPAWAGFDTATGQLGGTPSDADVGLYSNIVISVSDGNAMVSLAAFDIEVVAAQVQTGSLALNWTAPVTRADGTPLSLADINGYRVYYGESSGNYPYNVDVPDGTATSTTVSDLTAGDYYIVMTTYDIDGRESAFSSEILKTTQ